MNYIVNEPQGAAYDRVAARGTGGTKGCLRGGSNPTILDHVFNYQRMLVQKRQPFKAVTGVAVYQEAVAFQLASKER